MLVAVKSQDTAVKNFGFIAYDENGIKNIAFLPIESFEEFVKKNNPSDIRIMELGETEISIQIPFGIFKDIPTKFEIQGENVKFLIKV